MSITLQSMLTGLGAGALLDVEMYSLQYVASEISWQINEQRVARFAK